MCLERGVEHLISTLKRTQPSCISVMSLGYIRPARLLHPNVQVKVGPLN
jgi:hypothetical protein